MSRPRDPSHASSAPGCTSAAGNVAVAVVVASGGTTCGTSWGSIPAQLAPRAGGTGFTHQVRAQLLKCPSGRRCAERQLYDFSSHSGAAQTRPPLCGPPRLRQDGVVSEGKLSRPNWVKLFAWSWNHYWRTALPTGPPGSLTRNSPTPLLEKRINPELCVPFSSQVSPACGGAVTRAVGGAMSGGQLGYNGETECKLVNLR